MPPIFFSFTFQENSNTITQLENSTLTINLSLFNIISVHFHHFGPPFNKGMYSSQVRQRSVIEYLTAEGEMPIRIHDMLKHVYGDATVDVRTLRRWFVAVKKRKDKHGWLTPVRQWLRWQDLAFYRAGIHALVKRWTKMVEMDGDYIEKWQINRQCCGVTLCNCIWVFLKSKGEKNRRHYLLTNPRINNLVTDEKLDKISWL